MFPGAVVRAVGRSIERRVNVEDQRELVEAIAVWTENLRDAMSASSGIEQAITESARHAPSALAAEARLLAASVRYRKIDDALGDFADSLRNPTSDFVVAALILSIRHHTHDFLGLLTHLSDAARAETDLYTRVWVSRARTRTAVRIITASVSCFVVGLVVLNPDYLAPFLTLHGVAVLTVVCACFAGGLFWLRTMTSLEHPPRFLHRRWSA